MSGYEPVPRQTPGAEVIGKIHPADERDVRGRHALLTPRERQVMGLVVAGHTTRQIAHQLSVSPRTIDVHRAHIMLKMHTKSLAELVRFAVRYDLCGTESHFDTQQSI